MHILITGSKGLIGSGLKHALSLLNIHVTGLDIRADKQDPEYGDILNKEKLFSLFNTVDGVVHLAAISRVVEGEKNPDLCWKINTEGTKHVVEAAFASNKKPWVVYASSREVYGPSKDFPIKESSVLNPINIYGKSKLAAEQIIEKASQKGLITAIVRFSNVYGSVHDYPDRVIPAFCRAAVQGNDLRVEGSSHVFDFTHLEDVVQGMICLIRLLSQKRSSLPPIHLASGHPVTLGEIAKIAQEASSYSIKIVHDIPRSFDVNQFWGDTTLAHKILKWKASIGVREGMYRLMNHYHIFFHTCLSSSPTPQ